MFKNKEKLKGILNSRNIIIALLVIIIIILLFKTIGSPKDNSMFENGQLVAQDVPKETLGAGKTAIPVIDDFTVTKSLPYANLYNPEVNYGNSYLSYKFTDKDSGKVFYESKLVQPGQYFSVDFANILGVGTYNVQVDICSFDFANPKEQKNGGSTDITITVQE